MEARVELLQESQGYLVDNPVVLYCCEFRKMWVYLERCMAEKCLTNLMKCERYKIHRRFVQTTNRVLKEGGAMKEATLFHHDRRKFFRLVGLASGSQLIFWAYLAHFQYSVIPQLQQKKGEHLDLGRSTSTLLGSITSFVERHPLFLSAMGLSIGLLFSFTGWLFCMRNVNHIMLLRGSQSIRLVTHTPLGGTRSIHVPIENVSSLGSRIDTRKQIAVKVKGHRFFFLIDKEGTFVQPSLFDSIIGVKRQF